MMHVNDKFANFIWTSLGMLAQPTTLISIFGPIFLQFNLLMVRQDSLLSHSADPRLVSAVSNEWTVALTEWEIQFYTYVMGFLVLVAQSIYYFTRVRANPYFASKRAQARTDVYVIFATLLIILNLSFFFLMATGMASNFNVVSLYKPPDGQLSSLQFALPPFSSPITIGRYLVAVCGIFSAVAAKRYSNRLV